MQGRVFEFLKERGLIHTATNEEAVKKLLNGKPITFYLGIDPTADDLHIGHFCSLTIFRCLQEAGHRGILLVGGATAMVGDPSGKLDLRKMLEQETVDKNIEKVITIAKKFIITEGANPAKIVNNRDWIGKISYVDFLRDVCTYFNVNEMLRNDIYAKRRESGGLTFLEMGYMPIQAKDYEHLYFNENCRLEIGGSDQWGNIIAGVELLRKKHSINTQALVTPLLLNKDGEKMGKTAKGALWVSEDKTSAYDFYQYFVNVQDADVKTLLEWFTKLEISEIKKLIENDIISAKKLVAFELTKLIHGEAKAMEAQKTAEELFSKGGVSDTMPEVNLSGKLNAINGKVNVLDLLAQSGIVSSKGEAKRLIEQKGISIDNEIITNPNLEIELNKTEYILKKGKKIFLKVIV